MEQNKGNVTIFIVIGVVALAVGFFAGQMIQKSADKNVQDQMAKEIFGTTGGGITVNNFSGKITGISSDQKSISVEVNSPFPGINLPQGYNTKTVLITGDTKIISQIQKDPAEFSKEMADFQSKMSKAIASKPGSPIQPITPPSLFTEKTLTAADLKAGDQISFSFVAAQNQNILDNQFTATQINVTPAVTAPAGASAPGIPAGAPAQ